MAFPVPSKLFLYTCFPSTVVRVSVATDFPIPFIVMVTLLWAGLGCSW